MNLWQRLASRLRGTSHAERVAVRWMWAGLLLELMAGAVLLYARYYIIPEKSVFDKMDLKAMDHANHAAQLCLYVGIGLASLGVVLNAVGAIVRMYVLRKERRAKENPDTASSR